MHVVFCIPFIDNSGPSKGLVALANEMQRNHRTSIVYFKKKLDTKIGTVNSINKNITVIKGNSDNLNKLKNTDDKVIVISMCFLSDLLCLYYFKNNIKITYIRGNLFMNYQHDYGFPGLFLAFIHYQLAKFYNKCFVLNDEEQSRLVKLGISSDIIPNCLDEALLGDVQYDEKQSWDLIYVGNLNSRKKPLLILRSLHELKMRGVVLNLVIVGDGVLLVDMKKLVLQLGICDQVDFVGRQEAPYYFLAKSRVFVLPSISEGTSRALMEAAFHGNICVLRDLECNQEFSGQRFGFEFFKDDADLTTAILSAHSSAVDFGYVRRNLLPNKLQQKWVTKIFAAKLKRL